MDYITFLQAALLGMVEGLTEFIPVSSTGHLILLEELTGFEGPPGKVFEVFIQLGAIFAILWLYRAKFISVAMGLPQRDPAAWKFALNLLVALVPALVLGAALHGYIKEVLFCPAVVVTSLIAGGALIVAIEIWFKPNDRVVRVEDISPLLAFKIGLCQCCALVPGISRSGSTIMGALLLGVERKTAAEFSFFLAVPTMLAAASYDLYKNMHYLHADDVLLLATGFMSAFAVALLVVRQVLRFVGSHGYAPFGWYRIVLGIVMVLVLYVF
jgi:undecaprenyl-diphosphatase